MRKMIRLTESELRRIVIGAVSEVIGETFQRSSFNVLSMLGSPKKLSNAEKTGHWNDRSNRVASYNKKAKNVGDSLYSFVVDTKHPNGNEIHTITEKAFIIIQNERTGKVVTILAARPAQITRYWENLGKPIPNDLTFNLVMKFAENNVSRGLNNM